MKNNKKYSAMLNSRMAGIVEKLSSAVVFPVFSAYNIKKYMKDDMYFDLMAERTRYLKENS